MTGHRTTLSSHGVYEKQWLILGQCVRLHKKAPLCGAIGPSASSEGDTSTCFTVVKWKVWPSGTSQHVCHYTVKSLTGDSVYLISIRHPPLSTWAARKKTKNETKHLLIPKNTEEDSSKLFEPWWLQQHLPFLGTPHEYRAHMGSIIITWNSAKAKLAIRKIFL